MLEFEDIEWGLFMSCMDRLASRKFECIYFYKLDWCPQLLNDKDAAKQNHGTLGWLFLLPFDGLEMLLAMNS